MRKTSYRELILLKNVLRDEAVSAFAEAAENDDAEQYARALALLMERDEQHSLARRIAPLRVRSTAISARHTGATSAFYTHSRRRRIPFPRAYPNA